MKIIANNNLLNIHNFIITFFIYVILSFIFGSILFSDIIGKIYNVKIYQHYSKNHGATNVGRVLNKHIGLLVAIADISKLFLLTFFFAWFNNYVKFFSNSFLFIIPIIGFLGHCFPIQNKFHGGKGVTSLFATILIINLYLFLICLIVYFVGSIIFKKASIIFLISIIIIFGLSFVPQLGTRERINEFYFNQYYSATHWYIYNLLFLFIIIISILKHIKNFILYFQKKENSSPSFEFILILKNIIKKIFKFFAIYFLNYQHHLQKNLIKMQHQFYVQFVKLH